MTCEHEKKWKWSSVEDSSKDFEEWIKSQLKGIECIWLREISLHNALRDESLREVYYEEHNTLVCPECGEGKESPRWYWYYQDED